MSRLAVISQREWLILPGSWFARESGQLPADIALYISVKYFWLVLRSVILVYIFSVDIVLKLTIGSNSQLA